MNSEKNGLMKKFFVRFLLAFFAVAATIFAVEVFVRVFWTKLSGPAIIPLTLKTHRISPNPLLGYELVPGSASFEDGAWYRINQDGIRDRDYSRTKPAGTYRIAVLGDSNTFGLGVELEDTWPKQLEAELGKDGSPIEVINFGVMGYNTTQEAERIQEKVLAYSPDLILIGYSLNDIGVLSRERRVLSTYKGYDTFLTTGVGFLDGFLRRLKIYLLIKNRLYLKKTNADKAPPQYSKDGEKFLKFGYNRYFFEAYNEKENWTVLNEAFAKIRDMTRPKIPVMVVIHTELQDMDHYLFGDIHEIVKKLCADYGFLVFDPLDEMLTHSARDLRISASNIHPNPRGHKIFAQTVARHLRESSLVK